MSNVAPFKSLTNYLTMFVNPKFVDFNTLHITFNFESHFIINK